MICEIKLCVNFNQYISTFDITKVRQGEALLTPHPEPKYSLFSLSMSPIGQGNTNDQPADNQSQSFSIYQERMGNRLSSTFFIRILFHLSSGYSSIFHQDTLPSFKDTIYFIFYLNFFSPTFFGSNIFGDQTAYGLQ